MTILKQYQYSIISVIHSFKLATGFAAHITAHITFGRTAELSWIKLAAHVWSA